MAFMSSARPMTMLPLAPSVVVTILACPPASSAAIPSSVVALPVKALGKAVLVIR